jgi:hypothetical protein
MHLPRPLHFPRGRGLRARIDARVLRISSSAQQNTLQSFLSQTIFGWKLCPLAARNPIKLGKLFGRVKFVGGFMSLVLGYVCRGVFEATCPICVHIDARQDSLAWLQFGLIAGLTQGFVFALGGFAAGSLTAWWRSRQKDTLEL